MTINLFLCIRQFFYDFDILGADVNFSVYSMLEKHLPTYERQKKLYSSTNYSYYGTQSSSNISKPFGVNGFEKYRPQKQAWASGYSYRKKTEPLTYQSCIFNRPYRKNPFN